jgi:inosine kinase
MSMRRQALCEGQRCRFRRTEEFSADSLQPNRLQSDFMRFPGQRKRTHFFPSTRSPENLLMHESGLEDRVFDAVGIDQTIVDIVFKCDDALLQRFGLSKGGSVRLPDDVIHGIYQFGLEHGLIRSFNAGGVVGNTLHNYSVLSGRESLLLGMISESIHLSDYAFKYVRTTSPLVNLDHMHSGAGPVGRAITFVAPDGERSFAIAPGISDQYPASALPFDLIRRASCAVASLFLFRHLHEPIHEAQMALMNAAKEAGVPVVLGLGLAALVEEKRDFTFGLLRGGINVAAMNAEEAFALVQTENPILALDEILNCTDLVLITDGKKGLYIGAWVDESNRRETDYELHSKGITNYNRYEYSRAQRKSDCERPMKIYTHINPYLGGPTRFESTNGAGDAALAALIHDICANTYSRSKVPDSEKHLDRYLTYSSIAQIAKYANSVCYEVLKSPPRLRSAEGLSRGEPEKHPHI